MSSPLLSTKIYIPTPRKGIISRRKLIDQLNTGQENKLILVSAPAGYGKTTLLAEWIEQGSFQVGWVSLDEQDNDLRSFFSYFIASLITITTTIDESILTNLKDQNPVSITTFLSLLINQVSAFSKSIFLVLDDYHSITNPDIHRSLSYLLENLPRNMRLIIATRSDPLLQLAKLRAQGELCEIRVDDLRFTIEETIQYLNERMRLSLSQTDIATLTKKTEGWIVGLQLAGISLQKHPDKHQFVHTFAGNDRYIADYLFDEAFNRQPAHIQSFLLQTSLLNRLCAPLCDALLGRDDSQTILVELERANLFLVPLDSQRNWYRYHHLFASLLQHRLNSESQINETLLHQKASTWLAEHGFFNEALYHAIKANNIDQLSKLFKENIFSVVSHLEHNLLTTWASQQSETLLIQKPWICIAVARALIDMSQLNNVERYLNYAEVSGSADHRIRAHIAVARAALADKLGDQDLMTHQAQKALDEINHDDVQLRSQILIFLAKKEFWSGNLVASQEITYKAYEDTISSGDYEKAIFNLTESGAVQLVRGSISEGLKTLNKAIQLSEIPQQSTGQVIFSVAYTHFALADVLVETGQLEDACQHIQKGMHLCELTRQPEISYSGHITYSKYLLAIGSLDEALEAILDAQKLATLGGSKIRRQDYFTSLKARIYIEKGNLQKATALMDEIEVQASDSFKFEKQLIYRILAQLLVARGDYQLAIELLTRLIEVCLQADAAVHAMKAQIIKALAHYHISDFEGALESLTPALALAASEGLLVQNFMDAGEPMARLLYQASLQGIFPAFCNKLLERFSDLAAPDKGDDLVEPLSDRELEVLNLIAQGLTNQEVATELVLSLYTVKSHARNIFGKLGVKNRTEAVARARFLSLLSQD